MILAAALLLAAPPTSPTPRRGPAPRAAISAADRDGAKAPLPAWSPGRIAVAAPIPAATLVVRAGESLGHVAIRARAGALAIARANRLAPPYRLAPGRRLAIPAGRYHLVRDGEAGIAIARAYRVPWARVVEANGITEPFLLRAGERLLIPEPARPATLEERALAFRLDIDDLLTGGEPALSPREAPARPTARARTLPADAAVVAPPTARPSRFAWPVAGAVLTGFGPQPDGRRSDGLLLQPKAGASIGAVADGTVAYAGRDLPAYGGLVLVRHGGGWISAYAHLATLTAKRGQAVRQGQPLGRAARTRPRLLLQLRRGRTAVDPARELPPR